MSASREAVSAPDPRQWVAAAGLSCVMTALLWPGLLSGGGLVGGDIYTYFLPQKQLLAAEFAAGHIPLWHDRTALGYPLLAESQAAVFYPTTQLLYRTLDVHTAFHANFLLHYVLAGLFAWRFFISQRLSHLSSLFAAMVYVCSWFPARASLEWTIVGGVWLPLSLWLADRLLQKPSIPRLALLAAALATHLLAGHFTLAFINQLALAAFGFWKGLPADNFCSPTAALRSFALNRRLRGTLLTVSGVALAILLAAVQLRPTLELRRTSQRSGDVTSRFNPAYGHLPPFYLTQLAASWWYWHSPEVIASRELLRTPLASTADTNAVEAHFYIGLIPLGLCLTLLNRNVRQKLPTGAATFWLLLTLGSVIYASGWLVPFSSKLPGFGFFMGPGRYTILGTLALALLAGQVLDVLLRRRGPVFRWAMFCAVAAATFVDLRWSTSAVSDAVVVRNPPYLQLNESWLAKTLQQADATQPVRLLAPGANVGNLFGVSCVPQYLGLSPAAYFRPDFLPLSSEEPAAAWPDPRLDDALQQLAVTHRLTTEPIPLLAPTWELAESGPDAFLNQAWARGSEPCYLYRRIDPPNRLQLLPAGVGSIKILQRTPGSWLLEVQATAPAELQIADLPFPGWNITLDSNQPGTAVPSFTADSSPFHRVISIPTGLTRLSCNYAPNSFLIGLAISILTALLLAATCLFPRKTTFQTPSFSPRT